MGIRDSGRAAMFTQKSVCDIYVREVCSVAAVLLQKSVVLGNNISIEPSGSALLC